jgi:hypothetical protein
MLADLPNFPGTASNCAQDVAGQTGGVIAISRSHSPSRSACRHNRRPFGLDDHLGAENGIFFNLGSPGQYAVWSDQGLKARGQMTGTARPSAHTPHYHSCAEPLSRPSSMPVAPPRRWIRRKLASKTGDDSSARVGCRSRPVSCKRAETPDRLARLQRARRAGTREAQRRREAQNDDKK